MDAEHTPGPWNWLNYPDGRKLLTAPNRAVIHCPDAPMGVTEADARLIVAAPDLLAACEAILDDTTSIMAGVALCRAAVAKARGEDV